MMDHSSITSDALQDWAAWQRELRSFREVDSLRALRQLLVALAGYGLVLVGMFFLVANGYPYVLVLPLAILGAGFLMRLFVLFHDACHGSLFETKWANTVAGYALGILAFTPYHAWRAEHLRHHTTVADLDRRGVGDVWTMTVDEWRSASRLERALYRVYRHPVGTFLVGPVLNFVVFQRFMTPPGGRMATLSVHVTTLALVAIALVASRAVGLDAYIAVQLPILWIASVVGTWLFYIQHQFPGVYWARHGQWDPVRASLEGASYYALPPVLDWFSGSIGFHHVHHLSPRIPNYRLQACHRQTPALQRVTPLSLRDSLPCMWLDLWDEEEGKLVSFGDARAMRG
jgi:omega-6 fatty acid desaturase (delta-12 desaturase)